MVYISLQSQRKFKNTLKGFKKFTAILFIIVKPASKALLMKFELTSFTHWKYYANYYESIFEVECILISYKCCYPMFPSFHRQILKLRFLNTNYLYVETLHWYIVELVQVFLSSFVGPECVSVLPLQRRAVYLNINIL